MAELVLNNGSAPSPPSAGKTSIYADTSGSIHMLTSAGDTNVGLANMKTVSIPLNTSSPLTGTESNYVSIPYTMNGWHLVDVVATSGSSTSGSPAFRVAACPYNAFSGSQNMLTTNPIIGQVAYTSYAGTGSVNGVVNTLHATVSTGTKVFVYSASASTCGSGVLNSQVSLTFGQ